ncbi:Hsp20/alpha crystallin family protein [Aeribacillus pallidus]|jgi:HSP20 family molecular chaperone IbpA|uniref:Hsp20/alpha crystallin family protein n=1 Tax=Aeribacillus pallidus TaxID=33936 RepID=UPI003D1AF672
MLPWNLFPFHKNDQSPWKGFSPNQIEKYMADFMSNMMRNFQNEGMSPLSTTTVDKAPSSSPFQYDVFETFEEVFVRIRLKEDCLSALKLYHTSNQVILEHVPEENDRHVISLPALVKKKGGNALYKEGILELRFPKSHDWQFTELTIQDE